MLIVPFVLLTHKRHQSLVLRVKDGEYEDVSQEEAKKMASYIKQGGLGGIYLALVHENGQSP